MKLCFATNNQHKLQEVQHVLGDAFQLTTLADIGCHDDIPENQPTIAENSRQKAQYIWENYGVDAFADDTGLEIKALNGEPGVYSARYAGPQREADDNIRHVWARLKETDTSLPTEARFLTVITLVLGGVYHQFEGMAHGTIIDEKRGTNGFGYDPIFIPRGLDKTFAELDAGEKNSISHRGLALAGLVQFLKS